MIVEDLQQFYWFLDGINQFINLLYFVLTFIPDPGIKKVNISEYEQE